MGPTLGDAVVRVSADTSGLESDVKKVGRGGGLRTAILGSATGNLIADGVGFIAKKVVGVTKSIVDMSVGKGFDRALNIDTARFKLQGLGHDAESVDKIMDNALTSVKGTSFGLGDAGTAAAAAVAAGVKPGEDLVRVLSLVGDTAAITGKGFGESGAIINKVLASNRLGMEEVNQLQDAGLPILQMLADQYGINVDEMRKMVSEGKVGSADLLNAIETGVGGAAQAMGGSFAGMRDNMMAAFGRLGAQVIEPLMPVLQEFMGLVTEAADELAPLAAELGQALAPVLKDVLGALLPVAKTLATTFIGAIKDLVPALGPVISTLLPVLVNLVISLLPVVVQAATLISNLAAQLGPVLGEALNALVPLLLGVVEQIFPMLLEVLGEVIPVLAEIGSVLFPVLVEVIGTLLPALMPLIPVFLQIVKAVLPLLPPLAQLIGAILPPLIRLVMQLLQPILDLATKGLMWLADVLTKYVVPALTKWWEFLGKAVTEVANFVGRVVQWFTDLRSKIVSALGDAGRFIFDKGVEIARGLLDGVKSAWGSIKAWFTGLKANVVGFVSGAKDWLLTAGSNVINGLWNGMKNSWKAVETWFNDRLNWVKGLWPFSPAKHGPFSGKGSPFNMGRNFVNLLAKGMGSTGNFDKAAKALTDKVKKTMTKALDESKKALSDARGDLRSMLDARASMRDSIGSSLRGGLNLGDALDEGEGGTKTGTFASIKTLVAGKLAKAKRFVTLLRKLRDAGLPPTFLQEIVGMGFEDGAAFAQALLSGSAKEIKALVNDWNAFEEATQKAGNVVAKATYDVGIDAQRGIIKGLKSDNQALKDAAKVLAKNLEKHVRAALKSNSPSKVFEDIGRDTLLGLTGGMGDLAMVRNAANKAALAAIPAPASMGGFGGLGGAGGFGNVTNNTTVHVKVEVKGAATVEDGRKVGQGIEEALRELSMTAVTR